MTRTIVVDDDDPTIEEDWRIFSSLGSPNRISNKLPFQTGGNGGPISEHYTNTTTTTYIPFSLSPFSCQDRNHNNNIKNGSDRILCLSILAPKCCIKYSGLSMQHTLEKNIKKILARKPYYVLSSIGTLQTPFEFCSSKPRINIIPKY